MVISQTVSALERTVLVLGDTNQTEMKPLVRWLIGMISESAQILFYQDVESLLDSDLEPLERRKAIGPALERPYFPQSEATLVNAEPRCRKSDEHPDLIIVLQCWPDEFSDQDVNRLLSFAPLARIVVSYGSWCESLGRIRDIWPLFVRVPVWAAPNRILKEWRLLQSLETPPPPPWSASREETFAFDLSLEIQWPDAKEVAIDTPDPAYHQFLAEIMMADGIRVVKDRPSILFFDADPWGQCRRELCERHRNQFPEMVIVALVEQVHSSAAADLLKLGVTRIFHKLGFHKQQIMSPLVSAVSASQPKIENAVPD